MKTSVNSVTVRVLLFRLVLQISSVGGRQGLASVSYWDVCECGHAWRGKKTEEGTEAFWSFTLRCSLGRIYDWHAAQTFITAVPLPGHPGQISKAPPPGENQPLCSLPACIPLNLNGSFQKEFGGYRNEKQDQHFVKNDVARSSRMPRQCFYSKRDLK